MKVSIIQSNPIWEDPAANRNDLERAISELAKTDLIVLPEMFTTGFSMNPQKLAENMDGETIIWLKNLANNENSAITGSIIIKENGLFYNRLLFVHPSGKVEFYDKRHLFTLAGEDKIYTPGSKKLIVDFNGWKICLLICYDLRFPVFSRNVEGYDLLVYVANWPETRINAWDTLLKARAIENMCFVVGANRIGSDDNKLNYIGRSQIVDCMGNYLLEPMLEEGTATISIEKEMLLDSRKKFGFLDDRDSFTVN